MKEEECVMEERVSRGTPCGRERASFFFLSPLSKLVLLTGPLCWTWYSLVDTHSLSHTVESAQPGPGRAGISYLRRGQGRIIDQDPARGGVCVLRVRRRCGRCLLAATGDLLLDLGPVGWPSWLQRALKQPTRSKFHPHGRETRWQLLLLALVLLMPELLERGRTRMTLLLLKEALLCYRSGSSFCCNCNETARGKGGNGGRGAAVGIYQAAKKRGTLQQYWPNRTNQSNHTAMNQSIPVYFADDNKRKE
ncbi:hypothetical protein GGI35DRAFT_299760 [Trichoderma velutinum]